MAKPSQRKSTTPRKLSTTARKSQRAVSTPHRPRRKRTAVRQRRASLGQRVLLSGQGRLELRKLGVALAAEQEKDLYCVDLSRVAGQYIGETEKNLARVFAVAEATGAVLLLDEADALFGQRTEVKDSHDRYSNAEVSYLLERIEAYSGMVILASNNRKNLDEAFLRRLRFTSASQRPVRRNP